MFNYTENICSAPLINIGPVLEFIVNRSRNSAMSSSFFMRPLQQSIVSKITLPPTETVATGLLFLSNLYV